jgi:YggT family protein
MSIAQIINRSFLFLTWAVEAIIVATIALMVLRLIATAADLNPFSWASRTIKRLSDPFVLPARGMLLRLGVDPKFAPLIVILITILLGWFSLQLTGEIGSTLLGLIISIKVFNPTMALGFVLYGAVSIYIFLILMRIIFSWGMVSYSNSLMKFLVNITEPLLGPLRRMIPPLGMMDISPIFAYLLLWLLQAAIRGTLLRGGMPPIG